MNWKKILATIGLPVAGFTATMGVPKDAEADGLELMVGHEGASLDLNISTELGSRVSLYTRERLDFWYGEANQEAESTGTTFFGFTDLSLNIVDGLSVVAEAQYGTGVSLIPRMGASYFRQIGDVSLFGMATIGLANIDYEFIVSVSYAPDITEDIHVVLSLEALANVGNDGFGKLRPLAHVHEDLFNAAKIHGRFQLRDSIQPIPHEDHHSALSANLLALRLDPGVIKPIRRRPVIVGVDLVDRRR